MIYFDNAATTRVSDAAARCAVEVMSVQYGNPSSGHALGRQAAELLEKARGDIAASLGAKSGEVYFTSGGTESDNWAIRAAAMLRRHKGKHIISSKAEHEAVLQTLEELEREGFEVQLLEPDERGAVPFERVKAALREDTALVSLMTVNNETGAVTDIAAVSAEIKRRRLQAILHSDAVQAYMKIPNLVKHTGADMISVSAHKVHGMKGCGALYVKSGLRIKPIIFGGGQEKGLRSGTEALPQICAFAAAIKEKKQGFEREIWDIAAEALKTKFPNAVIISDGKMPNILCFSLPGYRSETLMNALDAYGICISKGSACKRGARSHVLEAMGLKSDVIDGAVRLSFDEYNTLEEAAEFLAALEKVQGSLFHR